MHKLITDYLKRSGCAPLSTEEPSSLPTVETSSSQRNESNVQTSRTIHINEEKNTNENNETISVQCKHGPDYSFPMKQFGKNFWFKNFSWLHYSEEKDSVFCMFCIKHKGKLTAEHNMKEPYITKGFHNWKKALEQSKAHRAAITYESVVAQCGNVLEMTVNDLNNKRLAEKKYLIKIIECICFLACQGLAFRGNDGNDNLTQLFKLLNKNDPALINTS